MESTSDTGVLARAFGLLRQLAAAGRRGASLSELATQSVLAPGTVHRLLRQLAAQGMVLQVPETRRYALGPVAFELGLAASPHDMRAIARPLLVRLAERTGDSVFLSQRSFDEAVCIDLQHGPSPIRVVTLEIGTRRPLGAGAGGLAILGALDGAEREAVVQRVGALLAAQWSIPPQVLQDSLQAFDRDGHAVIRNRVHAGISAVGVPVRGPAGQPIAGLSAAALNERMGAARIGLLVGELRAAATQIERALRAQPALPAQR